MIRTHRFLLACALLAALGQPASAEQLKVAPAVQTELPDDQAPLEMQVDMIKRIVPQARRVGVVYDPRQASSVAIVRQLQDLLPKAGLSLVETVAPRSVEVGPAARNLIGRVDVIYLFADDKVRAACDAVVRVGNENRIPLIASDLDGVRKGAVAALGRAAGRTVPARVAAEPGVRTELYLNLGAAARQGVTLPEALVKSAAQVIKEPDAPAGANKQ
jgi:putative ABC transport system substrate-binding protein